MLVAMVNAVAPYLSDDFRVQAAAFSLALSGAAEPTGAEEAAYNVAMGVFSEVVGIYYGKTYFGEEARQDVQAMVEQIVDVYRQRLTENEWLSDETREMAIRKLDHMSIHVGYPDEARPMYALLKTVPASEGGTLVDNMMAYTRASAEYVLGLCGQPVDRSEWPLSANTVNAMYTLTNNSINFPAAHPSGAVLQRSSRLPPTTAPLVRSSRMKFPTLSIPTAPSLTKTVRWPTGGPRRTWRSLKSCPRR